MQAIRFPAGFPPMRGRLQQTEPAARPSAVRCAGIRGGLIRQTDKIIDAGTVVSRQPAGKLQRQNPFAPFIFGIERLIAEKIRRDLLLCEVVILPQVLDPKPHSYHRNYHIVGRIVLLIFRTIRPKIEGQNNGRKAAV